MFFEDFLFIIHIHIFKYIALFYCLFINYQFIKVFFIIVFTYT